MKIQATKVEAIARACYEAMRAHAAFLGEAQEPWAKLSPEKRAALIWSAQYIAGHPIAKAEDVHGEWIRAKRGAGWSCGPAIDEEAKQHPLFVPFCDLPVEQQRKAEIFLATVRAAAP